MKDILCPHWQKDLPDSSTKKNLELFKLTKFLSLCSHIDNTSFAIFSGRKCQELIAVFQSNHKRLKLNMCAENRVSESLFGSGSHLHLDYINISIGNHKVFLSDCSHYK